MDENWVNTTSPWIDYSLDSWKPLTEGRKPVFYPKKCCLYHQDSPAPYAYIVKSGRVRITTYSLDGVEKQLYIAEPGCLFGEISCIMGFPHTATALCVQDTWVYQLTEKEITQTIKNDWEMNMRIFNSVFRKNIVFHNQILELSFLNALERIARLLLSMYEQYGVQDKDGYRLNVRFTHSDIASMINASRVTVNNTFTWLFENGYLKRDGQTVIITSLENLEWIADGGVSM